MAAPVDADPWAWVLILPVLSVVGLLFRRFGKVARGAAAWSGSNDFAAGRAGVARRGRTQQIVEAVRELLNPNAWPSGSRPIWTRSRGWASCAEERRVWLRRPATPTTSSVVTPSAPPTPAAGLAVECRRRGDRRARPARGPDLLGAPVMTAAGEPGYLEVCDRRSDIRLLADRDRAALDSMRPLNAAIPTISCSPDPLRRGP